MIDRQEDGSGTYAYRRPHELPSVSSCAQKRDLGGVLSFAHTTTLRFLANSRPSACAPPHLRLMRVSLVLHETHPAHVRSPRASYLSYGGRHPPFSGLPGSLSCSLDARMRAASCYHF
jgi:hypothetical protein